MALTVKDILDKNLFEGTRLAAGKERITNPVTGINVMEILDSPDTIGKGELLITTGYDLADEEKQKNLISRLKSRGVSAMAVQTGYYIDHIPQFILQAADQYQFPILDLPPRYSFSEILQTLFYELNRDLQSLDRSFLDYDYFFGRIRQKLQVNPSLLPSETVETQLLCISAVNAFSADRTALTQALEQIRSFLASQCAGYDYEISESKKGQAVFVLAFPDERKAQTTAYDLQIRLTFLSEQKGIDFYVGIDKITSAADLHQSFKHAVKCISLLGSIEAKRGVCPYCNYTFIKMFGFLYQNNRSFVLENQALQVLLSKDRSSRTNFVHTIRIYLSENCNVTRTAERLFIHRHTLINRIQTASELCGMNFSDYYTRIYFSMALLIHDYFAV